MTIQNEKNGAYKICLDQFTHGMETNEMSKRVDKSLMLTKSLTQAIKNFWHIEVLRM